MKLVYEHTDAELWFDEEHWILKAVWHNEVSLEGFRGLVEKGAQILNDIEAAHLIFDRRDLNNFTAEARVWFKHDFMRSGGDGRRLIRRVRKMAAIKGSSPIGQIASTVAGKVLLLFNPKLNYKTFEDDRIAEGWTKSLPLLSKVSAENNNSSKRPGLFGLLFR